MSPAALHHHPAATPLVASAAGRHELGQVLEAAAGRVDSEVSGRSQERIARDVLSSL